LPKARHETRRAARAGLFERWHKHGKRERREYAGNHCSAKDAAHAPRRNQQRRAKRAEHRAHGIHCTLKSECTSNFRWRDGIREERVARWAAAAAAHPSERAQRKNGGPGLRERIAKRRDTRGEVTNYGRGFAQMWPVGNPAARKFREARTSVGDAFDYTERESRRAEAGEKSRQKRCCGFVSPI
jgi:hypothetical protein